MSDIPATDIIIIPEGEFLMGAEEGQKNEAPVHPVWVDAFGLAKYPVSNYEYRRFLEATDRSSSAVWDEPKFNHPNQPVVAVSWFDAAAYCEWLSSEICNDYRLPTEAEREKAARGGHEGKRFPWGDEMPTWMDPKGRGTANEQPDLIGQDPPTGYGLHNMGDLVHEWCSDWYKKDYHESSPARNPQGPSHGERRASRGGSWRHGIKVTRCSARSSIPPDRTFTDYGFRVAITV